MKYLYCKKTDIATVPVGTKSIIISQYRHKNSNMVLLLGRIEKIIFFLSLDLNAISFVLFRLGAKIIYQKWPVTNPYPWTGSTVIPLGF